jgi:hypothetical protein
MLEGTTHHLYSKTARNFAKELGESFRGIIILRQPSDRILSSFLYSQNNLSRVDPRWCFSEYVDSLISSKYTEFDRFVSHTLSRYVLAQELVLSDYFSHIEKWFSSVGSSRIKILFFDQMLNDPLSTVHELSEFLEIPPPDSLITGDKRNLTVRIGHHKLHKIAVTANRLLPLGITKKWFLNRYLQLQKRLVRDPNEDFTESLLKLDEYFFASNRRLEALLGLDLARWDHRLSLKKLSIDS